MSRGIAWSKEDEEIMRLKYADSATSDLEKILGRPRAAINNKARSMGIQKSDEFWRKCGGRASEGWDTDDSGPKRKFRELGKHEQIPAMPGLLDHLAIMSGCMNSEIVEPNAGRRSYLARLEPVRPQIDAMLKQRISGYKIAQAIGVPHSTVYGYIKEIRAAA